MMARPAVAVEEEEEGRAVEEGEGRAVEEGGCREPALFSTIQLLLSHLSVTLCCVCVWGGGVWCHCGLAFPVRA
eukprot:COSAG02_NODE_35001_length_475_cov_0.973404_2_plen_73_part_01